MSFLGGVEWGVGKGAGCCRVRVHVFQSQSECGGSLRATEGPAAAHTGTPW
jgi:hypothetical protein